MLETHRTNGPLFDFEEREDLGRTAGMTCTLDGGDNPINASNVALPPRSNDALL